MIATGGLPGELVSLPDFTSELLRVARSGRAQDARSYQRMFQLCGCDSAEAIFEELRAVGFFAGRPDGMAVTMKGYRALLFISGALGAESAGVLDELRQLEPSLHRYQLVREGMTSRFIKGLLNDPTFQRLYFCSPWINVEKDNRGRLVMALDKASRALNRAPEILILVQTPKLPEVQKSLDWLRTLGAQVVEKPRLHSKLYMREPGPAGGLSLAIVGSQNLTRSKWIELGIEIRNDSYLLSNLRSYFFHIFGRRGGE